VIGLALAAMLALAAPVGCSRERTKDQPGPAAAAPADLAPAASAREVAPPPADVSARVAGPAAFDLALAEGGALLAWSPPRAQGGGLFVQRLDARGVPRGPATRLAQTDAGGEVIELSVAALGARVGVAWIESSAEESRTRALLVEPGEPSPPEPVRRALGDGGLVPGRSRIAVSGGRAGRLRIMHGVRRQDCGRDHSEPCTGYSFSQLGHDGVREAGSEWLRVPSPCPDVPPLLGASGTAFYYAVCAEAEGARVTTAYGIDVQNEYAHAVQVLAGCTPSALLAPMRGGALVVGRCDGGLRAAELGLDATRGARELALDGVQAVCVDAVITLRSAEVDLPLRHPLDGLEALLPAELAPEGSAAVFTGAGIVVVREQTQTGELALGRYSCERGVLSESR
jgi:hypothetical protein